jgi:rhodanese-related sulfurtransferase
VNVSPASSGSITSPNFSAQPTSYPATFTCSTNYALTASPNAAAGYRFDHWGGSYSGTSTTLSVSVRDGGKSVTAYFVLKAQSVSLSEAHNLINTNKDLIVIDVSSVADFNNSHMLCARNYPWNGSTVTGIGALTPYKTNDILVYDRTGAASDNAADYLASQGFISVYYMTDGLDDWMAAGYETFMTAEDGSICTTILPMAYAGSDKTANENASVTLNGQGWDPDGGSVTYLWTQVKGTNVTLSSAAAAQPTFTAPDLTSGSDELIFHLTVTDNEEDKDSDSVTVNVVWNNLAPTANAGPDKTVRAGIMVTLDGSNSTDPENTAALTYNWSVSAASGVSTPALSNASTKKPTFVTPNKDGWIEFRLLVTDSGGKTDDDKVKITIKYSPSSLTAVATSPNSIVLGWNDNSNNETGFKIEKKEGGCSSTNPWTQIAFKPANATSHTVSGLSAHITYSFRIKASGPSGDSAYSNCAVATTGVAGTPRSPTNLTATSISNKQVNLTWKDNSTNETGFQIWRKAGSGAWVKLATTAANIIKYNDTSASNNSSTLYVYYIKACNKSGCSPATNSVSLPFKPQNLNLTAGSKAGTINLTWKDKSSNETGFQIFRKAGSCIAGNSWVRAATMGPNIISWNYSSLASGSLYSYKIRAFYRSKAPFAFGYSEWSNCAEIISP